MGGINNLPAVPSVRERDIDLLVAHLASTSSEFVPWLLHVADPPLDAAPDQPLIATRAVINYSRPDAGGKAAGETDVLIAGQYDDGNLIVSVENKAWATAQPNQAERHRAFIDSQDARWKYAIVIAPDGWIASNRSEVSRYHASISVERIAEWCASNNHPFHAEVLTTACTQPTFSPALDLLAWQEHADAWFFEHAGLRLEWQRFIRTSNPGSEKPARWASFSSETLRPLPGMKHPWLIVRPSSTNHPCRVAVDISKPSARLVRHVKQAAYDSYISHRVTRAGTLIVELPIPAAKAWNMAAPFEEQTPYLAQVAQAAHEFIRWWDTLATTYRPPSRR